MTPFKLKVRRTAWRRLAQHKLPIYANNIVNMTMEKAGAYKAIQARLEALASKSKALSDALDAIGSGNHVATATKDMALGELYAALESVAVGLEDNAMNELYILEAGMELQKTATRHDGELLPVADLTAESNGLTGQALLKFVCPREQRGQITTFAVEWSEDDKKSLQNGTYVNAERITVKNLPNRKDIHFRICCLGTRGRKSQWSEAADTFVL